MASSKAPITFLTLPAEIRLQIYTQVLTPTAFSPSRKHLCPTWANEYQPELFPTPAIPILLIGTYPKRGYRGPYTPHHKRVAEVEAKWELQKSKFRAGMSETGLALNRARFFKDVERDECIDQGGHPGMLPRAVGVDRVYHPWTLGRICRLVREESKGLLDIFEKEGLGDVWFEFHAFTMDDMRSWVAQMGEERLSQVKRFTMEGMGWCSDRWWKYGTPLNRDGDDSEEESTYSASDQGWFTWFQQTGYCHRTVTVDLTRFEYSRPGTPVIYGSLVTPQIADPATLEYVIEEHRAVHVCDITACNHGNADGLYEYGCKEPCENEVNGVWGMRARAIHENGGREISPTGEVMVELLAALLDGGIDLTDEEWKLASPVADLVLGT